MYYRKFIEFLKEHGIYDEDIVLYYRNNWELFDYLDDELREDIGTGYVFSHNELLEMHPFVPIMNSDLTVLINVHEYIHVYMNYDKLNTIANVSNKDNEVLPIFYEKVYIKENLSNELVEYYEDLNGKIERNPEERYVLAMKISDELLCSYDNQNIKQLNRKVKRLVLKDSVNRLFNHE